MWAAKNVGRLTEASAFKLINDLDLKMRDTFILGYGSKIEIVSKFVQFFFFSSS